MLEEAKAYSSEELTEMRETMGPEADYLRGWSPRRWLATLAERDKRVEYWKTIAATQVKDLEGYRQRIADLCAASERSLVAHNELVDALTAKDQRIAELELQVERHLVSEANRILLANPASGSSPRCRHMRCEAGSSRCLDCGAWPPNGAWPSPK